jgi:Flp pilus assembly protein TadB
MKWPSSRSVAIVWLLAALSLVGWLIVNLDTAGWIILVLTVGLMAFELTRRRDGQVPRRKARIPDEPTG